MTNDHTIKPNRPDLSIFVVHMTRHSGSETARQHLDSIMRTRALETKKPFGWAKGEDGGDPSVHTQRATCFTETPLEHLHAMLGAGYQTKLEPYGVAIPKRQARRLGVNPIWYVGAESDDDAVSLGTALDVLRDEAVATGSFHEQPIARILPFFEHMGRRAGTYKEFAWEREWRHVGDFALPTDGVLWLCPETEIPHFELKAGEYEPCIDPRWSLEQIIESLAGRRHAGTPTRAVPEAVPTTTRRPTGIERVQVWIGPILSIIAEANGDENRILVDDLRREASLRGISTRGFGSLATGHTPYLYSSGDWRYLTARGIATVELWRSLPDAA